MGSPLAWIDLGDFVPSRLTIVSRVDIPIGQAAASIQRLRDPYWTYARSNATSARLTEIGLRTCVDARRSSGICALTRGLPRTQMRKKLQGAAGRLGVNTIRSA